MAAPAPIITSTFEKSGAGDHSFGIGFTTSIAKRPFIGVDDQKTTLPYISLRYEKFYIEGVDIGYNLDSGHGYRLDLLASPRFYERKPSFADNGELNNLPSTHETYLTGLSAQFHPEYGLITTQLLYDVLESDGIEALLQASNTFDITANLKLSPSVGVTYQNATLVDHFYGVPAGSALPGRTAYDGGSSINYNVTLIASWLVNRHIELIGQLRHEWPGDGITDSSIVDEDSLYFITAGVVYRF
jgi:outer membrane protein